MTPRKPVPNWAVRVRSILLGALECLHESIASTIVLTGKRQLGHRTAEDALPEQPSRLGLQDALLDQRTKLLTEAGKTPEPRGDQALQPRAKQPR